MNTKTLSALALSAIVAASSIGAVAPALAASGDDNKFDVDYYLAQLKYDGVNAIAVEQEGGSVIKATVESANGHLTFAFFDKDTLAPVKY